MTEHDPLNICHAPDTLDAPADIPVGELASAVPTYQRCISCESLGRTCGGPKLAALTAFEEVRAFHRLLRTVRGITLSRICAAAPQLGRGTVHDYFGHGGPDPKWVTVAAIDAALISICGDRVGEPPLEHTCPEAFADLHARNEALSRRLDEAEQEIARLTEALTAAEQSHQERLKNQRGDLQTIIDQQNRLIEILSAEKADYLRRIDDKSLELKTLRAENREGQTEIIRLHAVHAAEIRDIFERMLKLATQQ